MTGDTNFVGRPLDSKPFSISIGGITNPFTTVTLALKEVAEWHEREMREAEAKARATPRLKQKAMYVTEARVHRESALFFRNLRVTT